MPSKAKKTKKTSNQSRIGNVRIISGKYRSRKLDVFNADGLRPSTDRIRETIFNWLMHDTLNASVLDMFAGSGILGLESISRGAKDVTFIELNTSAFDVLKSNITKLQVEQALVKRGDALSICGDLHKPFSLIFIDPPFRHGLVLNALNSLLTNNLIADNALVYIEHEPELNIDYPPQLTLKKELRTGGLIASLFQYNS